MKSPPTAASFRCAILAGVATAALGAGAAQSQTPAQAADKGQVYLEADSLAGDPDSRFTAEGNVHIQYDGRTLNADKVEYDIAGDVVKAEGGVQILQPDGTAEFADSIVFNKDLTQGAARNFSANLAENGRLAAASIVRGSATRTELNNVIFTACELCEADGSDKAPTWSISADRVVRDEEAQAIYYRNAVLRIKDVPVFYLPVFSQADPEADRKSGLLQPRIQHTARRGLSYEQPVLWAISPYQDLVVTPQINTEVRPFINLDYRRRFYSGQIRARIGYTHEADFNNDGLKFTPEKTKAYILASGEFQVDEAWRWGFVAERARDRLLFDQYSIDPVEEDRGLFRTDDRRLLSQVYTVRQNERSYLSIAALSFQSLRPQLGAAPNAAGVVPLEDDNTLPLVAPLVEFRYEPEQRFAGGRLRMRGSAVLVERDASPIIVGAPGVDSRRATAEADWRRALILGNGVRLEPFAVGRGDLYSVADLNPADTSTHTIGRGLGVAGVDASWPLIRHEEGLTTILEPVVQLALSPQFSRDPRIPNEDSVAFDFDDTNLFEANKFSGFDLYEGGQRLNVGLRSSFDWGDGRTARFIVGRSFRSETDLAFPARTGLRQQSSDWVVGAEGTPVAGLSLYTRARLDRDNLSIHKIEAGADARMSRGAGYVRYMRQEQDFSGVAREDIEGAGEFFITGNWGVTVDAIRDLETQTWRRRAAGVVYRDDCLRFDLSYQRDNNPLLGPKASQSVVLRLTLATLGDAGYRNYANR